MRLLIDTDTASDDAIALVLAARTPGVEIVGVTIVGGNVDFAQQAENALVSLEVAGTGGRVPVCLGCRRPLVADARPVPHVHGADGMGDAHFPVARQRPEPEHAVDAIRRLVRAHPGELTVCAIGPLTNLAAAFTRDPELPRLIRRVYFMGGSYRYHGNISPVATFNVWADPEAARVVLRSGVSLSLIGFGLSCRYAVFDDADYTALAGVDTPQARFFEAVNRTRRAFCKTQQGLAGPNQPDSLTVAAAIDPDIITEARDFAVDVELGGELSRGQLVVDELGVWGRPPNATVCIRADAARYKRLLFGALGAPSSASSPGRVVGMPVAMTDSFTE
jgi:purine nucleosidase